MFMLRLQVEEAYNSLRSEHFKSVKVEPQPEFAGRQILSAGCVIITTSTTTTDKRVSAYVQLQRAERTIIARKTTHDLLCSTKIRH